MPEQDPPKKDKPTPPAPQRTPIEQDPPKKPKKTKE